MTLRSKLVASVAGLALAGAVAVGGAAVIDDDDPLPAPVTVRTPAAAQAADTDDQPLSRVEAARASRAAVRAAGGGTVTELDRSDDPGEHYEVEVVRDGREHDIALDEQFRPVPNRRYDDD